MSEKKVKFLMKELRRVGVPAVARRVKGRFLRMYHATPRRLRHGFDVLAAITAASQAAFSGFFHRLSPAARVKFLKRVAKENRK